MAANQFGDDYISKTLINTLPNKSLARSGQVSHGWVVLSGHEGIPTAGLMAGRHSYLLESSSDRPFPESLSWQGENLGSMSSDWPYQRPSSLSLGLTETLGGIELRFLCQGKKPVGAKEFHVEINPEYLWFWNAYPVGKEWKFVDAEGEVHELIRTSTSETEWKIEFRIEHLRTFLNLAGKKCIIETDASISLEDVDLSQQTPRKESQFEDDWGRFAFVEDVVDYGGLSTPAQLTQYLMGFSCIPGRLGKVRPPALHKDDENHPEFLIGLDDDEIELYWTSDPDELGNYFGKNPEAPHYLTFVYFNAGVLDKYLERPDQYTVTDTSISCFNLWQIEISRNSANLVAAYLGDIGKRLPSTERRRWVDFNVLPEGGVDEGRIKRDFLNIPAASPNALNSISNAVTNFNSAFMKKFGFELVRDPIDQLKVDVENLTTPTNPGSSGLDRRILVLSKWLVDGMDTTKLRKHLDAESTEPGIQLLKTLFARMEIEVDLPTVLQQLQAYRSRGGVAHSPNSGSKKARKVLGIEGHDAREDFRSVVSELVSAYDDATIRLDRLL